MRLLLIAALLTAPVAAPLAPAAAVVIVQDNEKCKDTLAKQTKRSIFGSVIGNVTSNVLGRSGVPSSVVGVSLPVSSMLSDTLLKLLDCKEQQQAAKATDDAIRGGVGTEANWKSETRPNVSGRSTVNSEEARADGYHCLTVTDVVIIDGEETTVPKRMCRAPGASGYAKA